MTSQTRANAVGRQLTQETDEYYIRHVAPTLSAFAEEKSRPELAPAGYELLFGPPRVGAEILFIGDQPGGGPELGLLPQPAARRPMWPAICDYADHHKNYRLACIIRSIFPVSFLVNCSGSERNFFRAADAQVYAAWPKDLREDVEAFSLARVKIIVEIMQPLRIIFIGKRPMLALMPNFDPVLTRDSKDFLLARGICAGIKAMGCRHLSGGRLRTGELDQISCYLRAFAGLT